MPLHAVPLALTRRLLPVLAVALCAAPLRAIATDCAPQALPAFDVNGQPGWAHVPLSRLKRDTVYAVNREGGETVLKATAQDAASAYVHLGRYDAARAPLLQWRWRIDALIEAADNTNPKREDAPVRVIVGFDGDKSTLPDEEQRRFERAKKLSGKDLPYATLMYIWENKSAVGSVIPSAHTARVKMIVAESGAAGVGRWRSHERNLVEDYRRAFGGDPGPIIGVAVMTDTDNTNGKSNGYYGAIRFACVPAAAR
jgi:hypothetical protein